MSRGLMVLIVAIGAIAMAALVTSVTGLGIGLVFEANRHLRNFTNLVISEYGEASFTPDGAVATFAALGYGRSAEEALQRCAAKTLAITSSIESLGVDRGDIETAQLAITPRYDWDQKPPRIIDYEAQYVLRVRTSRMELVGRVIDAAFPAGADDMGNL